MEIDLDKIEQTIENISQKNELLPYTAYTIEQPTSNFEYEHSLNLLLLS